MRTQDVVQRVIDEYLANKGATICEPNLNINHDGDFNQSMRVKFIPATDGKKWPYHERNDMVWPYNSKRI